MAKIMNWTDENGVAHPNAYFRITNFNIDATNRNANFSFGVWRDKAAATRDSNTGQPAFRPFNFQKNYNLNGAVFDAAYTAVISDTANIVKIAYDYASATTDTTKTVQAQVIIDGTPAQDKDGKPILQNVTQQVSFFDGSTDDI